MCQTYKVLIGHVKHRRQHVQRLGGEAGMYG